MALLLARRPKGSTTHRPASWKATQRISFQVNGGIRPVEVINDWQDAPWPPRTWQAEALPIAIQALRAGKSAVLSATMGSGKTYLLAMLCKIALKKSGDRAIVISVPTENLVTQTYATVALVCGTKNVGMYYGKKKQPGRRIIVACNNSMVSLAETLRRPVALWVCDEAHKSQCSSVITAVAMLAPACRLGVTATARRSKEKERLELFDEVVYWYTIFDALRDGVVVQYRTKTWNHKTSTRDCKDFDGICLDMIKEMVGPGIVNSLTCRDADDYAEYLRRHNVRAKAVHYEINEEEKALRIKELKTGALDCLVHVNMLSEGIDYPWLRWLCMRRKVGSKVRFAQEVGRILRACEGKDVAWLLDPHYLTGVFKLHTTEAVGKAIEFEEPDELADLDPEEIARLEREAAEYEAVSVSAVESWARDIVLQLEFAGLSDPYRSHDPDWRGQTATDKQCALLAKMSRLTGYLHGAHRETFRNLIKNAYRLPRGAASDLITVLMVVEKESKPMRTLARATGQWGQHRWQWPAGIVMPELNVEF